MALAQPIGIILALLSLLNVYSPNQDVAGVPFSDFKEHTAEKLGRGGNQFTWWELFKSAPRLSLGTGWRRVRLLEAVVCWT